MMLSWLHDDDGAEMVEATFAWPALLLFAFVVALAGRITIAEHDLQSAAHAAARAASIQRSAPGAQNAARTAANAEINDALALSCATQTTTVDTSGFAVPVGTPADVTATVTCDVRTAGLDIPGIPTTYRRTATATSPLDSHRERR